jgi:hypothetical protein
MMMMMTGINFSDLLVMKICTVFVLRTYGSARCLFYINILLMLMYPDRFSYSELCRRTNLLIYRASIVSTYIMLVTAYTLINLVHIASNEQYNMTP